MSEQMNNKMGEGVEKKETKKLEKPSETQMNSGRKIKAGRGEESDFPQPCQDVISQHHWVPSSVSLLRVYRAVTQGTGTLLGLDGSLLWARDC